MLNEFTRSALCRPHLRFFAYVRVLLVPSFLSVDKQYLNVRLRVDLMSWRSKRL